MTRRWMDGVSAGAALTLVLVAVLACKSNKADTSATTASADPTSAPSASDPPDAAPAPPASATATAAPHKAAGSGKADIIDPTGGGTVRTPAGMMPVDGTDCPGDYAGPLPPENKCHKKCSSNADCKSNNCMSIQNTRMCMAAGVVDNSNAPPEVLAGGTPSATASAPAHAAGQTVGVSFKGGDCPDGWNGSVTDANKCDKVCKTDADCGAGNKCKGVGPIGAGKQCQKG